MVDRYRDGIVPEAEPSTRCWPRTSKASSAASRALLDEAELSQALEEIWVLVRRLNRYVEESQPWVLAKDEADAERLDEVLYSLVEGLRVLDAAAPPLPAAQLRDAAGGAGRRRQASWPSSAPAPAARASSGFRPLFPKIEPPS